MLWTHPGLARRTYHGDTLGGAFDDRGTHPYEVRRILGGVPSADESCSGDYRGRLLSALDRIEGELVDATLLPDRGN